MDGLEKAIEALEAQRRSLEMSIQSRLIERQRGEDVIRGVDIALVTMRGALPKPDQIPAADLGLDSFQCSGDRINKITYCQDLGVVEVVVKDGTIRTHRGVDYNAWCLVKREEDLESGYYCHIWDKYPFTWQKP